MKTAIYWFRNDLRIEDNPAFLRACQHVDRLLPIYIHSESNQTETQWGFIREGRHRKRFLQESLMDLSKHLRSHGSDLYILNGELCTIFDELATAFSTRTVYCEAIHAPEELTQIELLKRAGFEVHSLWQSTMLDPNTLPFAVDQLPNVFSDFRRQIEKQGLQYTDPVGTPEVIPGLPLAYKASPEIDPIEDVGDTPFKGGEGRASAHIDQYFASRLVDTYKQTRNQLIGMDYSSKFSTWLAWGCSSARVIASKLLDYECNHGANEGTYWLWFELLWRDYFRFLHFKYGAKLYRSKGLSQHPSNRFDNVQFERWRLGKTGAKLVDAGMQELLQTGYLSNRMRQIVASYWIYDMRGDWQAGAAWFESQLIDYDVYSNQGNWLYIAGKGTDPRGGRAFNVVKQAQEHDPEGIYQAMWLP